MRQTFRVWAVFFLILGNASFAHATISQDLQTAVQTETGKHADVSYLVQLSNEFLDVDGKDPAEARSILHQIKREMVKLDHEGTMIEKFRPIHMTEEDIAAKIRTLAKYKKTAQNSGNFSIVKMVDVAIVCVGLFTGQCESKPELTQPVPISTTSSGGSR